MTWNEVERVLHNTEYSLSRKKWPFFLADSELEQIPISKLKKLDPAWKQEFARFGVPKAGDQDQRDERIVVDLGIEDLEITNKETIADPIREIDLRFFNRKLYLFRFFYTKPVEGHNKAETFAKVMDLEGLDIDPDCSSAVRAFVFSTNSGTRVSAFEVEDLTVSSQFSTNARTLLREAIAKHRQKTGEDLLRYVVPDNPLQIISKPRPAYTEEARRDNIQGVVELRVTFFRPVK